MTEYSKDRLDRESAANLAACQSAFENNDFDVAAYKIAVSGKTVGAKYIALLNISDEMVKTVTPNSACRNGCSHCCNMGVSVHLFEARAISKATGRRYDGKAAPVSGENISKYSGVPCPFLDAGRCTIYEVRPLACRTYFNMSDTVEICDIVSQPGQSVPTLNTKTFMEMSAVSLGLQWSDIRDWFPIGDMK